MSNLRRLTILLTERDYLVMQRREDAISVEVVAAPTYMTDGINMFIKQTNTGLLYTLPITTRSNVPPTTTDPEVTIQIESEYYVATIRHVGFELADDELLQRFEDAAAQLLTTQDAYYAAYLAREQALLTALEAAVAEPDSLQRQQDLDDTLAAIVDAIPEAERQRTIQRIFAPGRPRFVLSYNPPTDRSFATDLSRQFDDYDILRPSEQRDDWVAQHQTAIRETGVVVALVTEAALASGYLVNLWRSALHSTTFLFVDPDGLLQKQSEALAESIPRWFGALRTSVTDPGLVKAGQLLPPAVTLSQTQRHGWDLLHGIHTTMGPGVAVITAPANNLVEVLQEQLAEGFYTSWQNMKSNVDAHITQQYEQLGKLWERIARIRNFEVIEESREDIQAQSRERLDATVQSFDTLLTPLTFIERFGHPTETIDFRNIAPRFLAATDDLLVIGNAGTGKSTLLQLLAADILDATATDPAAAIPFVLNLSTWSGEPFAQWLIDEIQRQYNISRRIAESMIWYRQIIPMLDGFDEIEEAKRSICIDAVNAFKATVRYKDMRFIIAARSEDELMLNRLDTVWGTLRVADLTTTQVQAYLRAVDVVVPEVALDFLTTPLLLTLTAKLPSLETQTWVEISANRDRNRMIQRWYEHVFTTQPATDISIAQAQQYLQTLASYMQREHLTLFEPAAIQPSILEVPRQRFAYHQLASFIYASVVAGIFMLTRGPSLLFDQSISDLAAVQSVGVVASLLFVLNYVFMQSLRGRWLVAAYSLTFGFGVGAAFGVAFIFDGDIQTGFFTVLSNGIPQSIGFAMLFLGGIALSDTINNLRRIKLELLQLKPEVSFYGVTIAALIGVASAILNLIVTEGYTPVEAVLRALLLMSAGYIAYSVVRPAWRNRRDVMLAQVPLALSRVLSIAMLMGVSVGIAFGLPPLLARDVTIALTDFFTGLTFSTGALFIGGLALMQYAALHITMRWYDVAPRRWSDLLSYLVRLDVLSETKKGYVFKHIEYMRIASRGSTDNDIER